MTVAETIDLSLLQARPILPIQARNIVIILVGTGGTGSYLARHVARLAWVIKAEAKKQVSVAFIDPDVIEEANIARQDFCQAEIGIPKARALALRYSAAFGLEIETILEPFHPDMLKRFHQHWSTLTVVVSAVDNAKARARVSEAFNGETPEVPNKWWIDLGNDKNGGQVLIGTCNVRDSLDDTFVLPGYCRKLPSPVMQHPELLIPRPEELEDHHLSCEQFLMANQQSLMVNQHVAAYGAGMLYEFLITQQLRRCATYFHLPSGTASSRYITPETIADMIGVELSFFLTAEQAQARQKGQIIRREEAFPEDEEEGGGEDEEDRE